MLCFIKDKSTRYSTCATLIQLEEHYSNDALEELMETEVLLNRSTATIKPFNGDFATTAPGHLKVIRRDGTLAVFDAAKIRAAMTKAFLAVEGDTAVGSDRIHESVSHLVKNITDTFTRRIPHDVTLHI